MRNLFDGLPALLLQLHGHLLLLLVVYFLVAKESLLWRDSAPASGWMHGQDLLHYLLLFHALFSLLTVPQQTSLLLVQLADGHESIGHLVRSLLSSLACLQIVCRFGTLHLRFFHLHLLLAIVRIDHLTELGHSWQLWVAARREGRRLIVPVEAVLEIMLEQFVRDLRLLLDRSDARW